jgi:hypothetical protein
MRLLLLPQAACKNADFNYCKEFSSVKTPAITDNILLQHTSATLMIVFIKGFKENYFANYSFLYLTNTLNMVHYETATSRLFSYWLRLRGECLGYAIG